MILARPDVDEDVLFFYFTAHRNTQRKNRLRRIFLAEKRKGTVLVRTRLTSDKH